MREHIKFILAIGAIMTALFCVAPAFAQSAYSPATLHFGDQTNWRPMPTSGTLTGTYRTLGNVVQTGPITCNACRLYLGGSLTLNNTVTVVAGQEHNAGGIPGWGSTDLVFGYRGLGPGGGGGAEDNSANTLHYFGSGGGGFGGHGGGNAPGDAYTIDQQLSGSGAGGSAFLGDGGDGGGGLYIEARGNVTLTSAAAITANGTRVCGGGSGGGVDIRTMGSLTLNSGATITCNGANSGGGGGAGGGGYVNFEALGGVTNSGTVTTNPGTGGGATAGVLRNNGNFQGPRAFGGF